MTLEDFFTLTEMKDGLMALSRVEELVSVMRKDKDNSLKNVGEAARQWATVASTLAATENKESLDHFIRLDGLYFLDWWLQEAQKCSNDTNESSVEESISALLGALKKLPIDKERSLSSGIGETVKNLFGHKSCMVQERARALFDSWNPEKDNDTDPQDIEKDVGCHGDGVKPTDTVALDSGSVEASGFGNTHIGGSYDKDCHVERPSGSECQHSRGSDNLQSENCNGISNSFSNIKDDCQKTSSCVDKEDVFRENSQVPSIRLMPVQESLSNMKEMSVCLAERTSMGVDGSPVPSDGNTEGRSSTDWKDTDYTKGNPEKMSEKEKKYASTSYGHEQVSTTDPPKVEQPLLQPSTLGKDDADEKFSSKKSIPSGLDDDTARLVSKLKGGVADHGMPKHPQTRLEGDSTDQAGGCYSSRCILRKPEFQDGEDVGAVNSAKEELASEPLSKVGGGKDYASVVAISRPEMDTKLSKLNKRRSNMEYEYGVDDALEVARQVAKEVEQEVVDYREQFCSSSDKISEAGVLQPSSPDSINAEQGQHILCPESETPNRQNLSGAGFSANGDNHLIDAQNTDKAEDSMPDTDSSLVTEALQIPDDITKKGLCDFDLNKEVCSEEMDQPRTTCAVPITFVSASKAHAPSMPVAPLHFGGELGWKGSAATSAFRPASPRRTPDGEKTLSVDGSQISKQRLLEKTPSIEGMSQGSKQRQSFLNIDLNVAEGDNDGATDLPQARQIPVSSELASRESSIEVSSRRAERLKFDLNRIDDLEDAPLSDWRREGQFLHNHQNGSASPASSSSSRQPSMRNINLNDNPSCFDDSSDRRPGASYSFMDMDSSGRIKQLDPVISIMGTRVEINRKDFGPQTRSFLPNGRVTEFPISATIARPTSSVAMQPSMPYAPGHAISGYNLAAGSCMSLPPTIYGLGSATPCVVDSRGIPVLPQLMGAPVDVLPSYSRQQFLMSMSSSQTGLNRVGFAEPSLDLNSGLTVMEAEGREPGGFRQLFTPGQGISMEGSVASASRPLNLGIGMKRKEPDGGLDLYNVGYKHQTPWR